VDLNNKPANTGGELPPQEKTGRKNPFNRWKWITALVVLVIIAAGIVYYYSENRNAEPRLSVRQAVKIFAQEGIYLTKTSDPEAAEINGVKPAVYFSNDTEIKLMIYPYDSIAERKAAADLWRIQRRDKENHSYWEEFYQAKNLLLAFKPIDDAGITLEDLRLTAQVEDIIFEKLNDTQELGFTGYSDNWEAETTVKYYEHFYAEEDGTLGCDNYYTASSLLKYLGDDVESVGEISYTMQYRASKASGTGVPLNRDGIAALGSLGGTGSRPRADDELHFTVQWNGQEESFTAHCVNE